MAVSSNKVNTVLSAHSSMRALSYAYYYRYYYDSSSYLPSVGA